jgi:hypothetical protein
MEVFNDNRQAANMIIKVNKEFLNKSQTKSISLTNPWPKGKLFITQMSAAYYHWSPTRDLSEKSLVSHACNKRWLNEPVRPLDKAQHQMPFVTTGVIKPSLIKGRHFEGDTLILPIWTHAC